MLSFLLISNKLISNKTKLMINYNNDNDCDSELSSIFELYNNDKSPYAK